MARMTTAHNASEMIVHHKIRLYGILYRAYKRTFSVFGRRLLEKYNQEILDTKMLAQDAAAQRYAQRWAKIKSEQLGETTWKKIRTVIDDEGSTRDVEDAIRSDLEGDAEVRARTIARTETHGASQDSQFEVAQSIGLNNKRWIATNDGRTRETHVEADGQEQDMHDPFTVGEDELMYPGDPDGVPEEVINCRCIVVFE